MESDADLVAATAAAGGTFSAASIRKSGLEIKNRCMQKVVFGEILASIRKSGLEIKNRCIPGGVSGEKHAVIPKFTP